MRWESLPLKPTCCCMRKQSCHFDAELKIWSEQAWEGMVICCWIHKECPPSASMQLQEHPPSMDRAAHPTVKQLFWGSKSQSAQ